jgi:uncharacterized protein (TIGR03067 family)
MRTTALAALAVGLLLAAEAPGGDAKEELKKLAGTWRMVSGEQDGKALPEEVVKGARLVIKGDRHTVRVGGDTLAGTHRLDPSEEPKAIDATDTEGPYKGKTIRGIYKLEGGRLTVCFAGPGKARPKAFTTRSGTGHILHVWGRGKD